MKINYEGISSTVLIEELEKVIAKLKDSEAYISSNRLSIITPEAHSHFVAGSIHRMSYIIPSAEKELTFEFTVKVYK